MLYNTLYTACAYHSYSMSTWHIPLIFIVCIYVYTIQMRGSTKLILDSWQNYHTDRLKCLVRWSLCTYVCMFSIHVNTQWTHEHTDRRVQLCTHQCKDKIWVELLNVTPHAPRLQQSDWVTILLLCILFLALISHCIHCTWLQGSDWGTVSHASLERLSCPTSPCSATTFPNQSPHATIIDILYYVRISMMLLTAWIPPCSQDLGAKRGHTMCTYYTTGATQ